MASTSREVSGSESRSRSSAVIALLGIFGVQLLGRSGIERFTGVDSAWLDLRVLGLLILSSLVIAVICGRRSLSPRGLPVFWTLFVIWGLWTVWAALWAPPGAEQRDGYVVDIIVMAVLTAVGAGIAARLDERGMDVVIGSVLVVTLVLLASGLVNRASGAARIAAFGGGPNVFVRFMAVGCVFAIYFFILRRKVAYLALIAGFVIGAALSGSRGGLLGLGVALILLLLSYRSHIRVLHVVGGVTVVATAAIALDEAGREWVYQRYVLTSIGRASVSDILLGRATVYSSGRDVISDTVVALWQDRPVLGIGLGGVQAETGFVHAHNMFLQSLVETGVIGLIALVALTVSAAAIWWRGLFGQFATAQTKSFAAIACAVFVSSQFSGDYYDTRLIWFSTAVVGVFLFRAPHMMAPVGAGHPRSASRLLANGKRRVEQGRAR